MIGRGPARWGALVLTVAVLGVAACSDDDPDSESAGTDTAATSSSAAASPAPSSSATAATSSPGSSATCGASAEAVASGDPIVIGAIVGETGPDDFSSSADAASAYFECVNAHGGINGRPIEYLVEDDKWDPEVAGQVAARLVRDEQVVAMVGGASFVECGVNAELYAQEGVLSVPGVGVPRQCFESPNIAPINEGPRLSTLGVAQFAAAELDATSFVCIALNIPGLGDWTCDGISAWAQEAGVTSATQLIDPAIPDATSIVLDALSKDADAIILSMPAGAATPILAVAQEQDAGDQAVWIGPTSLYDEDFPATIGSYWNDRLSVQIELSLLDSDGADNQNWLAVMDEYGSEDDPRDSFSQAGYLSAKFVVDALLAIDDPATIDRAVASDAIRAITSESDLLCGPWYFGEGQAHNANHAGRVVTMTNDRFEAKQDCTEVQDPALADILAAEAALGID
jgi:branched-chain amino acid transport system substrate-binding protein